MKILRKIWFLFITKLLFALQLYYFYLLNITLYIGFSSITLKNIKQTSNQSINQPNNDKKISNKKQTTRNILVAF